MVDLGLAGALAGFGAAAVAFEETGGCVAFLGVVVFVVGGRSVGVGGGLVVVGGAVGHG